MSKHIPRMNDGIPAETILKYVQRDNAKLRLEVAELKEELRCKDNAIAAFKVWQKKVKIQRFDKWIRENKDLLEEQPMEKVYKAAIEMNDRFRILDVKSKILKKQLKKLEESKGKFKIAFDAYVAAMDALQEENEKAEKP